MKKILLFFLPFMSTLFVFSQKSEIGAFAGTSFYIGDLNPTTLFANPQFSGGLIYRYNFNPRWALKANIIFAKIQASDAENNNGYERNLSFHSPITEISAQVELNFLKLYNIPSKNHFAPYIFTGISVFSFNPQAQLNGTNYDLQHLGTEGQGLEGEPDFYSLTTVAIPFGIGIKLNIGRYISVGAEWGMRFTFTDYLDDVSKNYYDNRILAETRGNIVAALADRSEVIHVAGTGRGNFTTNDLYSFAGATITFKIGNEDKNCDLHYKPNFHKKLGKKR
jgi:hypothetical protein